MTQKARPTTIHKIVINLQEMHEGTAKLHKMDEYLSKAEELADYGNEVTLTGPAPVWMYLRIAHALHGKVIKLSYDSPATGEIVIFNHNPF